MNFKNIKTVKLTSSMMIFLKPLLKLFLKTCLKFVLTTRNHTFLLSCSTPQSSQFHEFDLKILVEVGKDCLWKILEFYIHSILNQFEFMPFFSSNHNVHLYIWSFHNFPQIQKTLLKLRKSLGSGISFFRWSVSVATRFTRQRRVIYRVLTRKPVEEREFQFIYLCSFLNNTLYTQT